MFLYKIIYMYSHCGNAFVIMMKKKTCMKILYLVSKITNSHVCVMNQNISKNDFYLELHIVSFCVKKHIFSFLICNIFIFLF